MTPRELITDGQCTPSCMAAITTARACRCPCRGRHHGLVADADVTALILVRQLDLPPTRHLDDLEGRAR